MGDLVVRVPEEQIMHVTLTCHGQFLAIEPFDGAVVEALGSAFYTVLHHYQLDAARGSGLLLRRWCPLVMPINDRFGSEVLFCGRGLEPLVIEHLQRCGFEIRISDPPRPTLRRPKELSALFNNPDSMLLQAVQRHERAIVQYRRGRVDRARLIAQVALAWPKLKLVVLVTRIGEAEQLKRQLRSWIPDVDCYHGREHPDSRRRVAVFTYAHAGGGAAGLTKRHIVIAYDAAELVRSKWGRECLEHCRIARLYGFLPDALSLPPHDRDRITAYFGTNIARIPAHGRQYRRVDVRFTRIDGGPRLSRSAEMLQLLREGVWQHPVRNRRLAAAADALANDDRGHRAPELADEFDWLNGLGVCRVVVLAANLEHALLLARKLSDWSPVANTEPWTAGLSADDRFRLEDGERRWRPNSGLIVTPDGLRRVRCVDVLVRADGGTGLPPLSDHAMTCGKERRRLLVVDAADRHHPRLRRRTRQRRAAYVAAEWNITGEEPQSELDRFLETRPVVELK